MAIGKPYAQLRMELNYSVIRSIRFIRASSMDRTQMKRMTDVKIALFKILNSQFSINLLPLQRCSAGCA
jgi:hypothetical protein